MWISLTDARLTTSGAGEFLGLQSGAAALTGSTLPRVSLNRMVHALGTTVIALVTSILCQAFEYQQLGMGASYVIIGIVIAIVFALAYLLLKRREMKKSTR